MARGGVGSYVDKEGNLSNKGIISLLKQQLKDESLEDRKKKVLILNAVQEKLLKG